MEDKCNNATAQRPQGNRTLDAEALLIDLPFFIAEIKNEEKWKHSDRNAITVFKSDKTRIVLIVLQKGATMIKHKTSGTLTIHVLEGILEVDIDEQSFIMSQSKMLALHEGISHSVLAKEESVFLLTVLVTV